MQTVSLAQHVIDGPRKAYLGAILFAVQKWRAWPSLFVLALR
jgi:hypothetical protein